MMNEGDEMFRDDEMATLIREAGSRPDLPPVELEGICVAARSAWEENVRRERRRATRRVIGVAAMAAALAVAVLFFFLQREQEPALPGGPVATVELVKGTVSRSFENSMTGTVLEVEVLRAGETLETAEDSWLAVRVVGGVGLRLDESTRATLVSPREVRLHAGGIYVDTEAAEEESKIEVRTPRGVARDIGTRFEVRVNPETEATVVRVRDGRVVIESRELRREVEAGTEVLVESADHVLVRAVDAWGAEWEWILNAAPPLTIEGRTLLEVLDRMTAETGWDLRFEDPALRTKAAGIILHGSVEDVRPDEAPFVLLEGSGLTGVVVGGDLVVSESR